MLALNGLSVTTISAALSAAVAAAPVGGVELGLDVQQQARPSAAGPPSIWPAFSPPCPGKAPTSCAPTVLAASVR